MNKIDSIARQINLHFDFLYAKGFQFDDVDYDRDANQNWTATLRSSDCIIYIVSDRNHISVEFSPPYSSLEDRIDLKSMVYLITGGERFVGSFKGNPLWGKQKQFAQLASLVREYIDTIIPYFGRNFADNRSRMVAAQRKYGELLVESLRQRRV